MIRLYTGSGASDVSVLGDAMDEDEWRKIRHAAIRLLRAREQLGAQLLEKVPFEIKEGTNHFQDEFEILQLQVGIEEYAKWGERSRDQKISRAAMQVVTTLDELGHYIRHIVVFLDLEDRLAPVSTPEPEVTSDTVTRALRDAENLIQTQGPERAVDRVHTALHGYLKMLCEREGIALPERASITAAFKTLRKEHAGLQGRAPGVHLTKKTLRTLASVVDALNEARNQLSPAHPSGELEEADAALMINAAKTILHSPSLLPCGSLRRAPVPSGGWPRSVGPCW